MENDVTTRALLLDDEAMARDQAKEHFDQFGITLETPESYVGFSQLIDQFDIILSDLNLSNMSRDLDGIQVLTKIRKTNKTALIGIYSAYVQNLTREQKAELKENDITVYSKADPSKTLHQIKRDNIVRKNSQNENSSTFGSAHYQLNKQITLDHLTNVKSRHVNIPVIKLKMSLPYDELINQIKNDTRIGNAFIIEFIENISLMNKYLKK